MMDKLKLIAITVGAVILIGLGVTYDYQVWSECRQTNSFLYCWRIMQR